MVCAGMSGGNGAAASGEFEGWRSVSEALGPVGQLLFCQLADEVIALPESPVRILDGEDGKGAGAGEIKLC